MKLYTGSGYINTTKPTANYYDKVYKDFLGRKQVGWVLNKEKYKAYRRQVHLEWLESHGYKFRNGSVPFVHSYGRSLAGCTTRGAGLRREYSQDEYYRPKRRALVRQLMDWGGLFHYNHKGRGWKRSKKRKQYEKVSKKKK